MKNIIIVVLALFMVTGCGSYKQTVQVDDKAYLLLIGETTGNVVIIDDGTPIDLRRDTKSYNLDGKTATKIEVPIGSHTLKVTRDGVLTVNRKFYVSTGTSFEVKL
jgi:uncharacterized protein YcfL